MHGLLIIQLIQLVCLIIGLLLITIIIFPQLLDHIVHGNDIRFQLHFRIDSVVLVLPSSISNELVVDWSLRPVGGSQKSQKCVEVTSFEKDLLSLLYVGNYFAQG